MHLRTLGGLELVGARVARRKPLLLCAYLALEGPQERRHLAHLFWPSTSDPAANLRVALSQLRSVDPRLARQDGACVWTDAVTDAQQIVADLERGVAERVEGVRGRFLDGVDGSDLGPELESWVVDTRAFISSRLHRGLVTLAERRLARGEHEHALDMLERALAVTALDELDPDDLPRLHTLLCTCASPHADRIAALAHEYGVALHDRRERVASDGRREARPTPATDLPAPSTRFVGRVRELAALIGLLDERDARLVTLHGGAGAGKTRLALEVARRRLDTARHVDGVRFVDLSTVRSVEDVPDRIARSVGVVVVASDNELDQLGEALQAREMLVVLDNCEHLDGVGAMAAGLVARCSGLRLLATSREPLGVSSEWIVSVAGLGLPDDGASDAEALGSDAARLFVARCARYTGSRPAASAAPAIARICRALAGNPLALELAAAWTRVMSIEALADELDRGLTILESGPVDLPDRQRGLRAAFEYSWSLLGDEAQRALARLSVFREGFAHDTASAVTGVTLPALKRLIDASLVTMTDDGRYERHPLLTTYAEERLAADATERSQTMRRHGEVMLELLRELYPQIVSGTTAPTAFARLRREEANVRAAVETALGSGLWKHLTGALPCIASYAEFQARYHFGHAVADEIVERLPPRPQLATLRALAHAVRGFCVFRAGDPERVERDGREALRLLEEAGESDGDAARSEARWWAHHCLAMAGKVRGDARACVEHALAARLLIGDALARDDPDRSSVLAVMAGINHHVACLGSVVGGDVAAAAAHDRASRAHLQRVASHADAYGAQTTALLALLGGDPDAAVRAAREGLAMSRPVDYGTATANLLEVLARSELARSDLAAATSACEEALRVTRDVGDVWLGTSLRALRGTLHAYAGDVATAASWYAHAFELAERHALLGYAMEAVVGRAELAAASGDVHLAEALLRCASEYPLAPFWIRGAAAQRLAALPSSVGNEALTAETLRSAMSSAWVP